MLVGEIGISRNDFLFNLQFLEAQLIIEGYANRSKNLWSATRWQTYQLLCTNPYVDLRKNGINEAADILNLPWDEEKTSNVTDEEIEDMQNMLSTLRKKGDK